jgi:phosphatidylserine/phosphatidylglycerophosphate/cardiolipin synthase-like enzyme
MKTSRKAPNEFGMRNWTVAQQPDLTEEPKPNSTTAIFSPRLNDRMLQWYADRLAAAKSSVHFTAAFGVSQEIGRKLTKRKRTKKGEPYLRYILLESRPSYNSSIRRKDNARAKGRRVPVDYWDFRPVTQNRIAWGDLQRTGVDVEGEAWQPLKETLAGVNLFVEFLHSKYMLIDPLSEDPVVINGSANFSTNSTVANDENMLIIRGDTRVADIFLSEFMRMFNHFHVRNRRNAMNAEEQESAFYLAPDDSWTAPYYKNGSAEYAERLLFS